MNRNNVNAKVIVVGVMKR